MPLALLEGFVRESYAFEDELYITKIVTALSSGERMCCSLYLSVLALIWPLVASDGRKEVTFLEFAFSVCLMDQVSLTHKLRCKLCCSQA